MRKHVRVLGTAPHEGMKIQMLNLAEEYPQVGLTVYIDDLEQGLVIIRNNFHGDYNVVISHDTTAQMLRQHLTIPMIEIDIFMHDIFYVIKLTNRLRERIAMVFFASIRNQVLSLCDLLECGMDIYTVDTAETIELTLRSLQEKQYHAILCDMTVNATARRLGINSFLITSGISSIRNTFHHALLLYDSQQYLRDENLFFRELIRGQIGQTIVFDSQGNLLLSTLDGLKPELLELLREKLS